MRFLKLIFGKRDQVTHNTIKLTNIQPQITKTLAPEVKTKPLEFLEQNFRFVAVDVETANRDAASICQIGFALVTETGTITTHSYLIDPEDDFEDFNVELHGIDEDRVAGQPTFDEVIELFRPFMERHTLVQHSTFDKRAFDTACYTYDVEPLRSKWIDSVKIARAAWPELKGSGGHGLANLKQALSLDFEHHDAGEDAKAAAQVVLLAETKTGQDFRSLAANKKRSYSPPVKAQGNKDGPLYGQVACFTGSLTISRVEAAEIAANAGVTVKALVSRKINLLVVGDQDLALLAGHEKSSKHRRAEELIAQNHDIKIIGENEFLALVQRET